MGDIVDEHPTRVSYLDALQLLSDAQGLLVIGSTEPHYTASKIFPYILARKPLMAIFHQDSSVVRILGESRAGEVVTFSSQESLQAKREEIAARLQALLRLPRGYQPSTCWEAFEAYTTRAMTGRLAGVLNQVTAERSKHSPQAMRDRSRAM